MAKTPLVLEDWIEKVRQAGSKAELFALLSEFQKLGWLDSQRVTMSHAYTKVLDRILENEEQDSSLASDSNEESIDNGPVWYEKM